MAAIMGSHLRRAGQRCRLNENGIGECGSWSILNHDRGKSLANRVRHGLSERDDFPLRNPSPLESVTLERPPGLKLRQFQCCATSKGVDDHVDRLRVERAVVVDG